MVKDIIKITKRIFYNFIEDEKNINSPQVLYDVYKNLKLTIENLKLVSNHYLALDFKEEFLQNSSLGLPEDKWRYFLNKDLEMLNESSKKYLINLQHLNFEDYNSVCNGFLSELYNAKMFYSFVNSSYNIGYIEPCSLELTQNVLDTSIDNKNHNISKSNKIDLSSYEKRVYLQKELLNEAQILEAYLQSLKKYLLDRYTLEDLL